MSDQNPPVVIDEQPASTNKCFKFTYVNMSRLAKFLQVFSALLLLVIVILRFVYFLQLGSLPNYIMTFYFVVFAVYLLLFELGIMSIRRKFYLMNFFWGKAIFDFFLGCMIISAYVVPAIDVPATIFFFATTIVLAITSVFFRKEERERIDKDLEKIRQLDEIKAKKLQAQKLKAKQLAQLAAQQAALNAQNNQNANQAQV
eukprot:403370435